MSSNGTTNPGLPQGPLYELADGSEAREFLLAERPRLVRSTLYLSLCFLAGTVVWSCFYRVDVVVSAPGIVRPLGRIVELQAPVSGLVTDVPAREGTQVKAGEVLLRFDPKPLELERERARGALEAKRAEQVDVVENRRRLLRSHDMERSSRETEIQQAGLQVELEQRRRELAVKQAKARYEVALARIESVKTRIAEQTGRLAEVEKLVRADLKAQIDADQERHALVNLRSELDPEEKAASEARLLCEQDETQIRIAENQLALKKKSLEELDATYALREGEGASALVALEGQIKNLEHELELVELRLARTELRAPVDGTVTRVVVLHAGRVVPEGATVAEISPAGREVVLEAYVRNSDRGKVKTGAHAKLRFAAFPHQDYGLLEGEVVKIAQDSDRPPVEAALTADGPSYNVTVSLAHDSLVDHRGRTGRIELGMVAQAEIVVDSCPLIFLLVSEVGGFFDTRPR
jgi:HlyD family secretion protein